MIRKKGEEKGGKEGIKWKGDWEERSRGKREEGKKEKRKVLGFIMVGEACFSTYHTHKNSRTCTQTPTCPWL